MEVIELAGSVLGQKVDDYTEQEKLWINMIANRLRDRECTHNMEREDMGLYVRAAGLIYELAKKLDAASAQSRFARKTMDQWLRVVTGVSFGFITEDGPRSHRTLETQTGDKRAHGKETAAGGEEEEETGEGPVIDVASGEG